MASTIILSDNGASSGSAGLKQTAGNDGVLILQTTTSGGTATNAVYVDNTQRVGLGVTPSAWGSTFKVLQNPGGAVWSDGTTGSFVGLVANAYQNGSGWRYAANGYASNYQSYQGTHSWSSAVSGSTDGVVSFVQALAVGKGTTLVLENGASSSGTGIAFPATQSASSDANTLDDYEEGTWTPSVGGNATYSNQSGAYTKVGRLVTVTADFTIGTIGTGDVYRITNLPFTVSNAVPHGCGSVGYYAGAVQNFTWLGLYAGPNTTNVTFVGNNSASSVIQQNAGPSAVLQNGTRIIFSVSYFTT